MSMTAIPREREAVQKQIQQDWANREYIEVITGSIKKITDFLNSFGKQCKVYNYFREDLKQSWINRFTESL